ncbi:MAG: cupin domain-containing protein [Candidatus Eremiobacteraeota bacterium]|nr:cupin domain-containing protein [Candidatus Eremiobacteraeota bacterium]
MQLHHALKDFLGKPPSEGNLAISVFSGGGLEVEFYEPKDIDRQGAHSRDEVYIIARGSGTFAATAREDVMFSAGDMLFVAAHVEHRFTQFSSDFATWVFFFGREHDA